MNLHTFNKTFLTLTSVIFFGTSVLSAQAEEAPIINVDFTVYSMQRLKALHFLHGDRAESSPLTFYSSARSEKYQYEGVNPIIFFKETPAPTPENPDAVTRNKVAEVNIPTPGGEYLFIFFSDYRGDQEAYKIYPLNDSTQALPYGAIRLFNATSFTLEGVLGKERIKLEPGPSKFYRVGNGLVSLGLGFRHGDKFHQSFNSPLELNNDARGLMMIFPPFVKGSAVVQTRFLKETPDDKGNTR